MKELPDEAKAELGVIKSVHVAQIENLVRTMEVWTEYENPRQTQNDLSIWRLRHYVSEALVFGYEKGLEDGKGM
jgi:hypothetical protein